VGVAHQPVAGLDALLERSGVGVGDESRPFGHARRAREGVEVPEDEARVVAAPHRDRKSTRLNSSHVSISYAVFCLKKKTIVSIGKSMALWPCTRIVYSSMMAFPY